MRKVKGVGFYIYIYIHNPEEKWTNKNNKATEAVANTYRMTLVLDGARAQGCWRAKWPEISNAWFIFGSWKIISISIINTTTQWNGECGPWWRGGSRAWGVSSWMREAPGWCCCYCCSCCCNSGFRKRRRWRRSREGRGSKQQREGGGQTATVSRAASSSSPTSPSPPHLLPPSGDFKGGQKWKGKLTAHVSTQTTEKKYKN